MTQRRFELNDVWQHINADGTLGIVVLVTEMYYDEVYGSIGIGIVTYPQSLLGIKFNLRENELTDEYEAAHGTKWEKLYSTN